jgi:hypothetical protein
VLRCAVTPWFVQVYTSDVRGAGTDANVVMTLYGRAKDGTYLKSDEVTLDNKGNNFEQGQKDQFKIELDEVGIPYKMRIGHDGTKPFSGWHLDRVSYCH